jgi:tetratricopeptide (TPR) repeat protein
LSAHEWKLPEAVGADSVQAVTVDESVVAPHLASMQDRARRRDEAEARLMSAIAAVPRSAAAHATLASLRLQQGRAADAAALLAKDLDYRDFFDHYANAAALEQYLGAVEANDPAAAGARKAFGEHAVAATKSGADVAEAWRLPSRAHLLAGDIDQAATAVERALKLAPADELYRFARVEVLLHQRDFEGARGELGRLLARG